MIVSILDKSSGFFSMLFFVINHYIYCNKNNINFTLNTDNWLFKYEKGWEDYFEKIDINSNENDNIITYAKSYKVLDNYRIIDYKEIINKFYIYNLTTYNFILNTKKKLNITDNNYDSIFIRRGDKLIKESVYINASEYINVLLKKNPNCTTIFLQTDDYNCYLELEEYININNLNIKLLTICDKNSKGFVIFNNHLNSIKNLNIDNQLNYDYLKSNNNNITNTSIDQMNNLDIYNHTLNMIIGIDIVLKSNICIVDYSSNVSRFIKLNHNNPNNVYDLRFYENDIDYEKIICPALSF